MYGQPPTLKDYPPTGWSDGSPLEDDIPVTSESQYTFSTINNTNCTLNFDFWFYLESDDENQAPIFRQFQVTILPGQSGSITVAQLFAMWTFPPNSGNWKITRTALWMHTNGMSDWMSLAPVQSGIPQSISGIAPPCNCFIPTFTFTSTGATLQIDPCP